MCRRYSIYNYEEPTRRDATGIPLYNFMKVLHSIFQFITVKIPIDMDLSTMSVEEFMKTKWDSDESDQEDASVKKSASENSNTAIKKVKKKRKKKKAKQESATNTVSDTINEDVKDDAENKSGAVTSHQKVLNRLQEKDPEFFEFLKKEDASLLHFDDNEFNLDDSSGDEDDGDPGVHKLPDELEEASDSDNDSDIVLSGSDEEAIQSVKDARRIPVTDSMVEKWKTQLTESKPSITALRDLIRAFHAAIARFSENYGEKKKKDEMKIKFKVESGGTFNAVVGLCIRHVVPSLAKILNYNPDKSLKKHKLPSSSQSWMKLRGIMQLYLNDVIALNQLLLEPSVVCAALRHTILLMPYFVSFPKITKLLLKFLVKSWSSADDESVRVLTFLCINRIIKLDRNKYLEPALRQTYLAYVANCKFTTPSLLPMINFMQQTLCELFALDSTLTYQLAFLYIRQLAIHLRKAMTAQKKENYQAVYNWQYVHCLGLWCRMVGNLFSQDSIKPLLYPLVQVALGTIDLVPTTRYFPLRYHIIRYLTTLSNATNTYIPLLPYITKPLKLAEFSKKKGGMMMEPLNFSTILKLSNSQLKETSYRISTMDEIYHSLMEYINTQAHTISFPEMMVPSLISLKKYAKNCKMPNYIKLIRQILDKVEENNKFILEKRSQVSFGVANTDAVTRWEQTLKRDGVPFNKHYDHYKKLHNKESQHTAADKNRIVEERLPVIDRKKFMESSKKKDKEEMGELFGNEDPMDGIGEDLDKLIEEGRSRKRKSASVTPSPEFSDLDYDESADNDELSDNSDNGDDVTQSPQKKMKTKGENMFVGNPEEDEPDLVEDFHFSSDEN